MTPDQAKLIQSRLGVTPDGEIGRGTLAVLFRKFGAGPERAVELALAANVHLRAYGIFDTPLRLAHFMAQLVHESGGFRYMEEIASGQAYEGRADLGNTEPGDGKRFKGRGPIQMTGRANYRRIGRDLGIDLENNPLLAAIPSIGMLTACYFWKTAGLNAAADADDILKITHRINGGENGLAERKANLAAMKKLLL